MQHLLSESQTIHVGSTKPQQSNVSPDLPFALSALLITTINLTSHSTPLGFSFASIAFILSLLNIIILYHKPILLSRPATILLLTFTCVALLVSRTALLGTEARKQVNSPEQSSLYMQRILNGHSRSSAVLTSTNRMLKPEGSSRPVDALKAVERSQHALPNTGDVDTEAHENKLDETRVSDERSKDWMSLEREELPPNLNGTFIVTTHRGESW